MSAPTPQASSFSRISGEVVKARLKFPGREKLLAALMEEVGELAQAMLQRKGRDAIEKESIQVACVAIRLLEEGDSDFDGEGWSNKP